MPRCGVVPPVGELVQFSLGSYRQLAMADCKYCNLYFCSITCLNKKRYSLELNAATPISKCVLSKLGMLVVQRHFIWLLCPYEGLGCEVPMEYHDLSFYVCLFFAEKNGGNKIKCSITKQWEGNMVNVVEVSKWKY